MQLPTNNLHGAMDLEAYSNDFFLIAIVKPSAKNLPD